MTDVEEIRPALRALGLGTARCERPARSARAVVRAGEAATTHVTDAAAFVGDGGLRRLDESVEAARRRGERDLARRGQRVRARFDRYRRAAGRSSDRDTGGDGRETARAGRGAVRDGRGAEPRTDRPRKPDRSDHFHPGHGTVLGDCGEGTDE